MSDPTRQALLRAICQDLEADDLRLIYADWLDDHGDSDRAELIRLQIDLADLDEDDPDRVDLDHRIEDLLAEHRARWLAEIPTGLIKITDYSPRFERGFPASPEVDANVFIARGEELLDALPVNLLRLREIGRELPRPPLPPGTNVDDLIQTLLRESSRPGNRERLHLPEGCAALAACPHLARIRRLCLSMNDLGPEHLAPILASPHLRDLTELDLGSNRLGPEGAALVARWLGSARLRTLSFFFGGIGAQGMAALAASPHLREVTSLQLHGCGIGTEGVRALVQSATLTRLTSLALGYNQIDLQGIRLLAQCPHLAELTHLGIAYNGPQNNGPGDAGVAILSASPYLRSLRSLDLGESEITIDGLEALVNSPVVAALRHLEINDNPIGAEGIGALARSDYLGELRSIDLGKLMIEDEGARLLADAITFRPTKLDLGETQIGTAGITAMARSPFLERVRDLDLSKNPIGDAGLRALAREARMPRLTDLDLFQCDLHAEGMAALEQADWLSHVRNLEVPVNQLGDAGGVALVRALRPGLRKLSLGSTGVGDQTALALANWPGAVSLRDLSIGHNTLTNRGLRALAESPYLGNLRHLIVWSNQMDTEGLRPLWARFGDNVYPQRQQWNAE